MFKVGDCFMGPNRTFIISTYLKLLSFDSNMVLVDLVRIYYLWGVEK